MQPSRALPAESIDAATSVKPVNAELALTLNVLGWGQLGALGVIAILVFDGQTSDSMFWYWAMTILLVIAVPMLVAGYRVDRSSESNQ
jgi:hypothetical protein